MNPFDPNAMFSGMFSGAAGSPVSSGAHGDIRNGAPIYFGSTGSGINADWLILGAVAIAVVYLVK
ncbi:MAG: hypothetical protein KZQ94_20925 [Candidatus Thiodiazotropha sp. (ex Troendleina suluensis)]|nr:hypothetical protein [Candidatus Thiodiazotropha sp. (ex Troendleina suluensis)]